MKTFESFGIEVGGYSLSEGDVASAIDLNLQTYKNLDLVYDEGRANEGFAEVIGELRDQLLEKVSKRPLDIVIVPKLGKLTLANLIERYDNLTTQKGNPETFVWSKLWNQYSADELNQGQTDDIEAQAILLGTDNDYNEPGLYFTNQSIEEQRQSLKQAQKNHESESSKTKLSSLSPAGYIIRNAMQLERGEPLQDKRTYTRFIELENRTARGYSCVPLSDSYDDGRLDLYGSRGHADSYDGVRLSVGLV